MFIGNSTNGLNYHVTLIGNEYDDLGDSAARPKLGVQEPGCQGIESKAQRLQGESHGV